jgi:hypothetical protein
MQFIALSGHQHGKTRIQEVQTMSLSSYRAAFLAGAFAILFAVPGGSSAAKNLGQAILSEETKWTVFDKSDADYFKWLAAHPKGFVLNTTRKKNPKDLVLHRPTCRTISGYSGKQKPGAFTERDFIKVCADKEEALLEWVRHNYGPKVEFSNKCGHCKR